MSSQIGQRKDAHLDLCLDSKVETTGPSLGLGRYTLEYDALPEVDLDDVDLSITLLGKRLSAPLIIGAMTGGTERARQVNRRLARAAAKVGVGMALGSQRAMIASPELTPTYEVRDVAPDLPLLFGNVGAVQFNMGIEPAQVVEAVQAVGADALNLHLNPLQEAIQPEGDTRFAGLTDKLRAALEAMAPLPCLIKEVGAGIGPRTAAKLADLPLAGVECSGTGGTSWARVESLRAAQGTPGEAAGQVLAGFGVPTDRSIVNCRAVNPDWTIVASGGVRTGLDAAVALALGADAVAMARPLLVAAVESEESVVNTLESVIYQLRVVCFCTGARDIAALKRRKLQPSARATD